MKDLQNYQHIASYASYVEEIVTTTFYMLLEDAGLFMTEEGDYILLEG